MTVVFSGCGIAGTLHFGDNTAPGNRPDAAAVHRMTTALAHRGPSGEGMWQQPGIVLGHRRLAVTGIGAAGDQPMTRDHLTLVYNGETYNAPALRAELSAHFTFTSRSDTEVVLRAWQYWGANAVHRLEGMFAFALWDARTRQLSLVRDRIGIKPLYYHQGKDFLLFASEIEALLASGHVPRRPHHETLARQLLCSSTLQIDQSATPVERVRSLAPATTLTVSPDGRLDRHTYWQLPDTPTDSAPASATEQAHQLADLLGKSVDSMLMGDVPVAAFLSGGLDSSAISALASRTRTLPCVTTAYGDDGCPSSEGNEDLTFSRAVARHLADRVHHHVSVQPHVLGLEDLDAVCDLAAVGDDPRHVAILGNYQAVRDLGLRVVLNGQGADEIMGGYIARPAFVRHILDTRRPDTSTVRSLPASRQIPGLSSHLLALQPQAHADVLSYYRDVLTGPPLERVHRLLVHTQLTRVVQFEDFLAMRMSVEARFPFLDHRLVDWAFQQPFTTHVDASARHGKVHLTTAMRGTLPNRLLDRPKAVFPFPDMRAVQASLAALVTEHHDELTSDPLVNHMFAIPADPAAVGPETLWPLLALWRWHHKLRAPARAPVPA
ncbi:asparagine synthase (glutamine-hydrolyzing) [Streptomyces sp. NBC_00582]|uniref:asparagine synthase (glutamine-hydrolyzing) n=1 Tax=Streptomyces sp. NBC_00582 TaxID=2975783 RepID=UPI002E7FF768|nr:asparagine synthase (glutamine-hydrolyzing) [Streptomyces sp. NBC_00582]WUB68392.1 asparagine synthase (glutamine-hydrolyzing) [Streptomyces sp. NBC_00582]